MTADGMGLTLRKGGSVLEINGKSIMEAPLEEYEMIYVRFAELLKSGKSDTDVAPCNSSAIASCWEGRC